MNNALICLGEIIKIKKEKNIMKGNVTLDKLCGLQLRQDLSIYLSIYLSKFKHELGINSACKTTF